MKTITNDNGEQVGSTVHAFERANPPLPKIITVTGVEDHGPCDGGATAVCPHCGADGRYVWYFLCEDGTVRGAMAGCIKLFPKHPLAEKVQHVFNKQMQARKERRELRAEWDVAILEATELLVQKQISTQNWESRVSLAFSRRAAWLGRKYGVRR